MCAVTSHFQNALQPLLTKPVHLCAYGLPCHRALACVSFIRPTQQQLIVCLGGDEILGGHVSSSMITDIDI